MKKLVVLLISIGLLACSTGGRDEKDLTDGNEQNISPDQQISEEEQHKKDSTSSDIIGEDTTQRDN